MISSQTVKFLLNFNLKNETEFSQHILKEAPESEQVMQKTLDATET